jgi:hypothetical protein
MNKSLAVFTPDNPQPTVGYMPSSAVLVQNNKQNVSLDWLIPATFLILFVVFLYLTIKFVLPKVSHYLGYLIREFEKGKKQS